MTIKVSAWAEYIGQRDLKSRLRVHITAAIERGERLDHVFLYAPPGSGKTTLAELIALEMGQEFVSRVAPIKPPMLKSLVRQFEGVLLIDEIHRFSKSEQESLLTLLGEQYYETDYGVIENHNLTIVGATTEREKVIAPLKDRFPIVPLFVPYSDEDMTQIVQQMGRKIGISISHGNATALARATCGAPRHAEQFVIAARDLGTQDANAILRFMKCTPDGLSTEHLEYIELLCRNDILGLDTIATYLGRSKAELLAIERLLVAKGFLTFSKTGRVATTLAHKTFNKKDNKYAKN